MSSTPTKHRPHPITRAEAARQKGVTKGAVTHACASGGALHAACLPNGRIDANHPAYRAWLAAGQQKPTQKPKVAKAPRASTKKRRGTATPKVLAPKALNGVSEPADINDLLELRLGELLEQWGSITGVADWLDARKRVAEIARLESRNERDAGRLLAKALVRTHVLGQIQGLYRQLLESYPTTLETRVSASVRAGESQESRVELVRSLLGRELRPAKDRAIRALRHCRAGDTVPEVEEPETAGDDLAAERRAFAESLRSQLAQLVPRIAQTDIQDAVAAMLDAAVTAALKHVDTRGSEEHGDGSEPDK